MVRDFMVALEHGYHAAVILAVGACFVGCVDPATGVGGNAGGASFDEAVGASAVVTVGTGASCEGGGTQVVCTDGTTFCDFNGTGCPQDQIDQCGPLPEGTPFVFRVHNTGSRELRLAYGCGEYFPIVIGGLNVGKELGDPCGVTCDEVSVDTPNPGCAGCGSGMGVPLPPGSSVEIPWDHHLYLPAHVPFGCKGIPASDPTGACALGVDYATVLGTSSASVTIMVCNDQTGPPGYCDTSESQAGQTVDLSGDSLDLDVQ